MLCAAPEHVRAQESAGQVQVHAGHGAQAGHRRSQGVATLAHNSQMAMTWLVDMRGDLEPEKLPRLYFEI